MLINTPEEAYALAESNEGYGLTTLVQDASLRSLVLTPTPAQDITAIHTAINDDLTVSILPLESLNYPLTLLFQDREDIFNESY